ncbi:cytochrome c [Phycisphaerales bacterium AB-hyl4]|uniref:Cytochrome c n=1 Tax=Natronomicrosphaera hydrolytica TaxID=3242702 RepID=A0ABV4U1V6_9BACT
MARDVNNPNDASNGKQARLPSVIDKSFHLPRPPFWLIALLLISVVASWIPLSLIALSRVTLSERRPIELFQGMGDQPSYRAQSVNPLFEDNRAMRPPVPGTVGYGRTIGRPDPDELRESDHYYRGYQLVQNGDGEWEPEFFEGLPPEIEVNAGLMQRGRERYDIYCYPCHGMDGAGDGPINERAQRLMAAGPAQSAGTSWAPASDLHARDENTGGLQFGPELFPDGELFSVITHGIRNMPGYAQQIDVADRWAIVAYVRALQLSQDVPADELTPEQLERLRAGE